MARVLTDDEYVRLVRKALGGEVEGLSASHYFVSLARQAHRLLCEGRKVEDLTPAEQIYAAAFDGALLAQIPNDYGWEPGIETEVEVEVEAEVKAPKPKKNGK